MDYTILEDGYISGKDNEVIIVFPPNLENCDYQAYLRWLNGEEENGTLS